jgi:GntR family transcriptional regulator, rspAB operon transcriptional repressor
MKMQPVNIAELLIEQIAWLELEPEKVINISELSAKLGVSRTPIKEALIYLEAKGWVMRQGLHFSVTPLSLERMREIADVRSLVEVNAYIWAMQRISKEQLMELQKYKAHILPFNNNSNIGDVIKLDQTFHMFLFKVARNRYVMELLENSIYHSLRFWLAINSTENPVLSIKNSLVGMIEAIEAKDEARLRETSTLHIRNWVDRILGAI